MNYTGKTYKADSGQWSWSIRDDDGELCAGAGYEDEDSAAEDMADQLAIYTERKEQ